MEPTRTTAQTFTMSAVARYILLSLLLCPQVVQGGLLRGSVPPARRNTYGRVYVALQPIASSPKQQQTEQGERRRLAGKKQLVGYGSSPLQDFFPLKNCEGDCDSDADVSVESA